MNIIRYQTPSLFSPVAPFSDIQEEMARLFDVAFPNLSQFQKGGSWSQDLPLDLYQDKENYYARIEVPGFRKEDLGIEVANGVVTVTAHQKVDGSENKNGPTQERRFTRAFSLPSHADAEKIQARYEQGILTLTLPKKEEAKPRQIAVEVK